MPFLRKYNTLTVTGTTAIRIPLIKRAVVDFAVSADYTPSAGDVKIAIDGAAAANVTNLPTAVTMGNTAYWEFVLTAAELTCKSCVVTLADSATKAVEDQSFTIETYGHASAMYQADLSAANLPANVTQLLGTAWLTPGTAGTPDVNVKLISDDATAANNAEAFFDGTGYAGTGNVIPTVTNLTNAPPDSAGVTTLLSRLPAAFFAGITSLASWLGAIAGKAADAGTQTEMRATTAGASYTITTDSLEAIRDRGDAAWITATGFSTHSAADVWAVGTRELTAGTNIVLAKGTGVTGFNDLSAAQVNAEVDTAFTDYAPSTAAALASLVTTVGVAGIGLTEAGGTGDQFAALPWNAAWDAEVQSEVIDALQETVPDSIPADGTRPSMQQAIYMMCQGLFEGGIVGTTWTVKKVDSSTTLFTVLLDDATTPTSKTRAT